MNAKRPRPSRRFSIRRGLIAALSALAVVAATALSALPAQAATPAVRGTQFAGPLNVTLQLPGYVGIDAATYTFFTTGGPGVASDSATWKMSGEPNSTITSSLTARITEAGTPTTFWVLADLTMVDRGSGTGVYNYLGSCHIYQGNPAAGGTLLDQATNSPYTCGGIDWTDLTDAPTVGGQHTATFTLASLPWSTVRGVVAPSGTVSLDKGYFETSTDNAFVNDQLLTAPATGYQSIASGKTVTWVAFERNGENLIAPAMRFSYRILDGGVPTGFWVKGFAQNERDAAFHHSDSCEIYKGDPLNGGLVTTNTPYSCGMSDENVSGRGDWQVTFAISRASVIVVKPLQAQELLTQACSGVGGDCLFVPTAHSVTLAPNAISLGTYSNEDSQPAPYGFKYASSRSTTNSVNVTAKTGVDFFEVFSASVSFSYGWSQTDETQKVWNASMTVMPGCVGEFKLTKGYDVFTGDYLFAVGGQWYRAPNVVWTVPQPNSPGNLGAYAYPIGNGHAECSAPGVTVMPGQGKGLLKGGGPTPKPITTPGPTPTPTKGNNGKGH